jgi:hypothetical protein
MLEKEALRHKLISGTIANMLLMFNQNFAGGET